MTTQTPTQAPTPPAPPAAPVTATPATAATAATTATEAAAKKKNIIARMIAAILAFFRKIFDWIGKKLGIKTDTADQQNAVKKAPQGQTRTQAATQTQVQDQAQAQTHRRGFGLFGGGGGYDAPRTASPAPAPAPEVKPTPVDDLRKAMAQAGPTANDKAAKMPAQTPAAAQAQEIAEVAATIPRHQQQRQTASDAAQALAAATKTQREREEEERKRQATGEMEGPPSWLDDVPMEDIVDFGPQWEEIQDMPSQAQTKSRARTSRGARR